MKHLIFYFISPLFIFSCTNDIKYNSPAFEGQLNNAFWRAIETKAFVESTGELTIEAYTRNEVVKLTTVNVIAKVYKLGASSESQAEYILNQGTNTISFNTEVGNGSGEVVIEEYDAINKTVTGTFKFLAVNINQETSEESVQKFQFGKFYKVGISSKP